jgi:4-hydroxy-3-methylbut-2-enyl diphosphate reductase
MTNNKPVTKITIDQNSGFCAGVINAIRTAEEWLERESSLYCLGDIVHNSEEMQRLADMGLQVISHEEFRQLRHTRVLIRAHGEPPETYRIAKENDIEIIDATCKVVLHLQRTIRQYFEEDKSRQILIFGKQGHAEVIGLLGQTDGTGIVITSIDDIEKIDTFRPTMLFSQTTQNFDEYHRLINAIKEKFAAAGKLPLFNYAESICGSVVGRAQEIHNFASHYDSIIFVSGEKSSNGLYLYNICKNANHNTFFVSTLNQIDALPDLNGKTVGICGATSTPMWLMKKAEARLSNRLQNIKTTK